MSAAHTFGSPLVEEIGDEAVTFERFTMRDYGHLEACLRANRKAIVGAASLPPISVEDIDIFLSTSEGATKALCISLQKAGRSEAEARDIAGKIPMLRAVSLAREVVGFVMPDRKKEKVNPALAAPRTSEEGIINWAADYLAICKRFRVNPATLTLHQFFLLRAEIAADVANQSLARNVPRQPF